MLPRDNVVHLKTSGDTRAITFRLELLNDSSLCYRVVTVSMHYLWQHSNNYFEMMQAYVSYISGKKQARPCFVHYTLTITSILDKVTFRII